MKFSPLARQVVPLMKRAMKQIKLIIHLHTLRGIIIFQRLSSLLEVNFNAMVTLVEFH